MSELFDGIKPKPASGYAIAKALLKNGWYAILPAVEKDVLNATLTYASGDGIAYPSVETLAADIYQEATPSRINHLREARRSLARRGLLRFPDAAIPDLLPDPAKPDLVQLLMPGIAPRATVRKPAALRNSERNESSETRSDSLRNSEQSAPKFGAPYKDEQPIEQTIELIPPAAAAVAEAAEGKIESIKAKAKAAHADAVAWWCGQEGWELVEGRKYHFNGGRDAKAVKTILEYTDIEGDLEQFKRIARIYLRDRTPYFEFHPLHRLAENVEKFRAKLAAPNSGATNGNSNNAIAGRIGPVQGRRSIDIEEPGGVAAG